MPKCKSDEQTLAHWVFSISHLLQRSLLVVDFLVFRHVCFVAEVVEVASIGLGVEFRDERSALRTKGGPIDFGEVWVGVDVFDGGETL